MEPSRFRFGLYEFDATTRALRREGVLVRLQAQPGQVLACLIEHAGQVVSRDTLRAAVWGDATFVDFDSGLNFCMSQLRSALKDDSAEPTYIRTIPKSGYQFIAPVERIAGLASQEQVSAPASPSSSQGRLRPRTLVLTCAIVVVVVLALVGAYKFRPNQAAKHELPIVAVLRFDNETGDPGITGFSDGLTDNVVEQLTSLSNNRYQVIGNARILRLPREQRDLKIIASELHAGYVILGQVQSNGSQTRVLAHLIRMPEQTHLWVVRADRTISDPLSVESELAQKIATEFSPRVSADSSRPASPAAASR
jgi:DNA-binding winged helix-turn-helix (wHTH) protein/TolB-like protein